MDTHSPYPVPGQMIGPYRIDRRIGGGGMGVVYEAYDAGLDRQIALKVISPHLADDPGFRARFTREARAQASLDSPYVVQVYAHGEVDGRLYIATQYVPDGDLGAMLQTYGAPPVPIALDVIGQVASGLADAHAAGLIHRDIKPANVLLRRGDRLRAFLADFGIARRFDGEVTSATVGTVGTPSYMAPELHTGGTPGVASDVYSLGCLLWATLSGRAPYAGTSEFEIVTAHLGQPVPQLTGHSPQIDAINRILRTAMAKAPEERYHSAAAMRDDLVAAAQMAAPVTAAPSPPKSRAGLVIAAVVLLLLIVAGGGAAYALTRGGDDSPSTDPTTSPTPTPTESPTESPTQSPTESESASESPDPPDETRTTAADEKKAAARFASALAASGQVNRKQANCIANKLIDKVGLDKLIQAGVFDEDLNLGGGDINNKPAIKSALVSSTIACVAGSVG